MDAGDHTSQGQTIVDGISPAAGRRRVRFIYGWSTGHVGTTQLSSPKIYNATRALFLFEGTKVSRLTTEQWSNASRNYIVDFVNTIWNKKNSEGLNIKYGVQSVFVDLGHHTLYFGDELLEYFAKNRSEADIALVRIRRDCR